MTASQNIPRRFPVVMADRVLAILRRAGDMQVTVGITLAEPLDQERLARAFRLLLDAEPILGCRLVLQRGRPAWERRDDLDVAARLWVEQGGDPTVAAERFLVSPGDPERDPLVKLALLAGPPDLLLLRTNHMVLDGGGAKACAYLLADLYTQLGRNPDVTPTPNVAGRRSLDQLTERLGAWQLLRAMRSGLADQRALHHPPTTLLFPVKSRQAQAPDLRRPAYVFRRLGADAFRTLRTTCAREVATLNDLLTAAYASALLELARPERGIPIRVRTTVDLRRYLPGERTEALCNASAFNLLHLGTTGDADLAGVGMLHRVKAIMRRRKDGPLGLGELALFGPVMRAMPFSLAMHLAQRPEGRDLPHHMLVPVFTNIGRIDPARLTFDGLLARDAYVTASVIYLPTLGAALTGFGESLTLSAGLDASIVDPETVRSFFERIEEIALEWSR